MLPFMAQGAVMAIEDGLVLARCLARDGITNPAVAFRQYERERVERANRCVRAAERNRELFHSTRLADVKGAEQYVGTEWSEQRVFDRYDWLFSYDATARPETVQA